MSNLIYLQDGAGQVVYGLLEPFPWKQLFVVTGNRVYECGWQNQNNQLKTFKTLQRFEPGEGS